MTQHAARVLVQEKHPPHTLRPRHTGPFLKQRFIVRLRSMDFLKIKDYIHVKFETDCHRPETTEGSMVRLWQQSL